MTDLELEQVTGGTPTLAQCLDASHAAYLPATAGGSVLGWASTKAFPHLGKYPGPGRMTAIGALTGLAASVAGGCWNAANGG